MSQLCRTLSLSLSRQFAFFVVRSSPGVFLRLSAYCIDTSPLDKCILRESRSRDVALVLCPAIGFLWHGGHLS